MGSRPPVAAILTLTLAACGGRAGAPDGGRVPEAGTPFGVSSSGAPGAKPEPIVHVGPDVSFQIACHVGTAAIASFSNVGSQGFAWTAKVDELSGGTVQIFPDTGTVCPGSGPVV